MKVTIDKNSGFCFGVVYAIQAAEEILKTEDSLFCLGDIVHNNMEVERLEKKGLKIIDHETYKNLKDVAVLIRAHGEPPSTYQTAIDNNIRLIDASCPVVLKLQNRLQKGFSQPKAEEMQTVIYGKNGHAEVIGLSGQTHDKAIVISNDEDLDKIDYAKPIQLYSQTTQSMEGFHHVIEEIENRASKVNEDPIVLVNDSICRQVSHRAPQISEFAKDHDVIVFVSGKKSSNGKYLHSISKKNNIKSYFVSTKEEIDDNWFKGAETVGVCGATSTPMWVMEEVEQHITKL